MKTLMSRNACNGEKSPEGRRLKLDARSGPLEGGDLSETGKIWQKWREIATPLGEWHKW